jgi:hypothetical protein
MTSYASCVTDALTRKHRCTGLGAAAGRGELVVHRPNTIGCRARCPCGHGRFTWTFTVDVAPTGAATRQQVKRGGFARKQDALDAMQAELVDRRRGAHVIT